ncbi:MAG: NfeD family protein [Candidatus Onthomonas sp.]
MIPATLFWVLAIVVFVAVEGITVGLTSIWFAVGALASLLISFFVDSLWVQIWVFLIVSLLALFALKPLAAKYFSTKGHQATNSDRILGKEAVVLEEVNNLENRGRIKVLGQEWTARSLSEEIIPVHTVVTIDRIEGVKVFVSPKA